MKPLWFAVPGVLLALAAVPVLAQPVISAKSGMVAKVQGTVYLDDQVLEDSATHFPDVREKQVVRTEDGLAEVLLTPGVFLRLGEKSSMRMISNRLIDTRVELLTGSAVVESDDVVKDTSVTIICRNGSITMPKIGIYRFNAEPAEVKVYKGAAEVQVGDQHLSVPAGKMVVLSGETAALQHFDTEDTDFLDHWNHQRSEYVAMANVSAAKSLVGSSSTYSGLGWGLGTPCMGAWGLNAYYGMMTYIPCSGYFRNPYGYMYWSPFTVMRAYYGYYGGGYYNGGARTGAGAGGGAFGSTSAASTGRGSGSVAYGGSRVGTGSMSSIGMGGGAASGGGMGGGAAAGAGSGAGAAGGHGGHGR